MIDSIREAIEVLRDPAGREPEGMVRLAAELERLISDDVVVVVGLRQREATALCRAAAFVGEVLPLSDDERSVLGESSGDAVLALESAQMRLETAMMAEGVDR